MSKKAILIYSGGIDSTVLLYKLLAEGYEVRALAFNYGQKHVKELLCAKQICSELGVELKEFDLREFSNLTKDASPLLANSDSDKSLSIASQTVVPNRNAVMLSIAVAWAQALNINEVYIGVTLSDSTDYPDCRKEFIEAFEKAMILANANPNLRIKAPLANLNKTEVVKLGLELGVPFEKTWTCYRGERIPCGECASCKERAKAFAELGVEDPLLKMLEGEF